MANSNLYKLEGQITISVITEIEADTLEKAIELAEDLEVVKNELIKL